MVAESKPELHLEIAHVLFVDVVGYSKLLINDQSEILAQLNQVVRDTPHFREAETAGKLIRLPTGDGMALVFLNNAEAPVKCALEISKALRSYPHIQLRMGVHSGPINPVSDVNDRANVTGAGINMAQRVMDCGDAGHILLSRRAAEDLEQYRQWQPCLHDLGECEVKHGVRVHVFNLRTEGLGNPKVPTKFKPAPANARSKRRLIIAAAVSIVAVILALGLWRIAYRPASKLTPDGVAMPPDKSIAVLPLENLSDDKENAFFADGIQDDILTSLAKIADLKVISRTSVMQYRGATRNLREIAQALGVANILEGSVRRVANRALINVQLVDARNDRHIWAERYDRTIADAIGLQGELASEIANALKAKLAPEEKVRLATKPTTNPEAYLLYLRALERARTAASKQDAFDIDELYAKAIELDPGFALAIARRAMWNTLMYDVGRRPQNKAAAPALAAQALQLSPDLPEAHVALGLCYYRIDQDYPAALREFSIAAAASTLEPDVLDYTAEVYCQQGRWREGLATYDHAQEIDPKHAHSGGAEVRAMLRDWPAAVAGYERLLRIAPEDVYLTLALASVKIAQNDLAAARKLLDGIPPGLHGAPGQPTMVDVSITMARCELNMLTREYDAAEKVLVDYKGEEFLDPLVGRKASLAGRVALARGDLISAKAFFEKARPVYEAQARDHPNDARFHASLGRLYAYLGRKDDALREGLQAVELAPESKDKIGGPTCTGTLALIYTRTGEVEQAVAIIERLLTLPAGPTLVDLRLNWEWDPLRTNARFQKIVAGPEPKTIY
jgi:serine/threonine-protein kinase